MDGNTVAVAAAAKGVVTEGAAAGNVALGSLCGQ